MDMDNSVVINGGRRVGGDGGGYGGINSDGQRFGGVNTQYSVKMMCCKIVPLKPV